MNNLYRAIRRTFRYRLSIALAVFCAVMIALLWGGSIGAIVYPITKICFNEGTFTTWIESQIAENRKSLDAIAVELGEIDDRTRDLDESSQKPVGDNPEIRALEFRASRLENKRAWQEYFGSWYRFFLPYAEKYTPATPFATVVFLVIFMLISSILKSLFTIAHNILSADIAQRGAFEIREEFFRKVIGYEVNHFNRSGIADTMSRFTNDMTTLTGGLNVLYGKLVREPLKMVACLVGALLISWQLLLLTLLLVPLVIIAIRWLARSIKRVVRHGMEEMANMYGRLEETFRSIRVVKAFTRESYERTKFRRTNRAYYLKAMKIAKYEALTNPLTELCGMLMISVAVLVGAYLLMSGKTHFFFLPMSATPLDKEMLITFFALLAGAADPARKLSDIFTAFQSAAAAADRIYVMIDRPVTVAEIAEPQRLERHRKSILFDRVCFRYDDTRPVLDKVTLDIPFGETIAVVGPSGCGKSTLLSLIPRFADPDSGEVLVDELPVNRLRIKDLRRQIGLVTQDPVLFDDTVLANIRYGNPWAKRDQVVEAAKKAFAHEFIEADLPEGYATSVGPGGSLLSGGQRQRIALARAILKDPTIFLLDEATSQIDINSEQKIHEALRAFTGSRTTILVTHRLAALELADRIVVMRDGVIEAVGPHEELFRTCEFYANLYRTEI